MINAKEIRTRNYQHILNRFNISGGRALNLILPIKYQGFFYFIILPHNKVVNLPFLPKISPKISLEKLKFF